VQSSTVIIVAYNSGEALTRCLDSLEGADAIVVSNGERGPEIEAAA
jgi:GT2 family glycosyltransferase